MGPYYSAKQSWIVVPARRTFAHATAFRVPEKRAITGSTSCPPLPITSSAATDQPPWPVKSSWYSDIRRARKHSNQLPKNRGSGLHLTLNRVALALRSR